MQSLKQKPDFFFLIQPLLLSPTTSVLRSNHHKSPGIGKNTIFILPRAAGSRVIFYTSISRRGVCIIAWKSGKDLPVWEAVSGKMRLLQLFWKIWGVESSRKRARIQGEEKHRGKKKLVLKQEKRKEVTLAFGVTRVC